MSQALISAEKSVSDSKDKQLAPILLLNSSARYFVLPVPEKYKVSILVPSASFLLRLSTHGIIIDMCMDSNNQF